MENNQDFPENFLWGAATSSYQVEGGIDNSELSSIIPAGLACDQYHLFESDFQLLKDLGQNSHRFSIEWSRVEPSSGTFDEWEIEHYRKVLQSLKDKGIKTMVTLHHFSNPLWFAKKGGFSSFKSPFYFCRFARRMFEEYSGLVDFWATINEPEIYSFWLDMMVVKLRISQYLPRDKWNPFKALKAPFAVINALFVYLNLVRSHKRVYKVFHSEALKKREGVKVGSVINQSYVEPFNKKNLFDRLETSLFNNLRNDFFLNCIKKEQDFIGLNYYTGFRVMFPSLVKFGNLPLSEMDWEVYPEGIYHLLHRLRKYGVPIYITENGIADEWDTLRKGYLKDHLTWISQAIKEGVDVRGYFHWSLIDNFEWDKGISKRFGLVRVNFTTMEREIKESGRYYADVCRSNRIMEIS